MYSAIIIISGLCATIAGFLGIILNENDAVNWLILGMVMFILDEVKK